MEILNVTLSSATVVYKPEFRTKKFGRAKMRCNVEGVVVTRLDCIIGFGST